MFVPVFRLIFWSNFGRSKLKTPDEYNIILTIISYLCLEWISGGTDRPTDCHQVALGSNSVLTSGCKHGDHASGFSHRSDSELLVLITVRIHGKVRTQPGNVPFTLIRTLLQHEWCRHSRGHVGGP